MNGSETAGSTIPSPHGEPIAVIGLSCRLPGAVDPDALWELLRDGRSAVTEAPADRWSAELLAQSGVSEPARGGFLDEVAAFDAAFFGVSPREAQSMDPQQRLALELGWEALENARIRPERLHGHRTGVYIGATVEDYAVLVHQQGPEALDHHTPTGLNRGLIANRLSYHLGLRGPSMTLDTAQSSSLVAVQSACDSLRRGDCDTALAGGVHLNLAPESTIAMARFGALSPSGRCHTFDARADGFVRGEGGGLVVLKPLSRALADGDHVHCVIHGGAVNNDGGGPGLTTPDAAAQEEVLRLACARAGIHPGDIGYVELHGTGTKVGDPIEAASLGAALGTDPRRSTPLPVGSIKTNIGHLEGAAGIAGLLKVVLCVEHGHLVPSLNFATPNPDIPFDALNLRVQTESGAWTAQEGRQLVAGVSSFGMGGTNAHVIVGRAEEAERAEVGEPISSSSFSSSGGVLVPWVVSARSAEALAAQAERLASRVAGAGLSPVDVGWSLVASRSSFEHRAVVVGAEPDELVAGVRAVAEGRPDAAVTLGEATGHSGGTVYVFPGQGSQWVGMAVELLDTSPVFAGRLAECEAALEPFVDWSLTAVLRGVEGAPGLDRVDVVQPVLWAVMVSLAEVWRAHGVEPAAVVGHSQGEIAAACVAGALSLEDGGRVVALRSKAIRALSGRGGMVSVALPRPDVEELIEPWNGRVSVAAVNGPSSVVVSGDGDVLGRLVEECREREIRARRIEVDYASHSAHVESIEQTLREVLAPVAPRTSTVPLFSTATGDWLDTADMDAGYWFTNLRRTVEFAPAIEALTAAGHHTFVEVSPHPVLTMPVQETVEAAGAEGVVVGTLRRGEGGLARFHASLGELYVQGVPVDWSPAFAAHRPRLVDLPTYAFQRERHWVGHTAERPHRSGSDEPGRSIGPTSDSPTTVGPGTSRPTLDVVREHAAAVLGHRDPSALHAGRTFKDLGFDSVTAVELRNRLNRVLTVRLPSTALYNHPSPTRLARYIDTELLGATDTLEPAHGLATDPDEPIAIVAMACRYPGGVQSPDDLWQILRDRVDAVTPFPTDRGWPTDGLYDPDPERSGTSYVREGGFLDAASFDAGFFGISPREALAMDPQQRLLLETSWEVLERAGIDPTGVRGSLTGVFVGAMAQEYGPRLHQASHQVEGHVLTGTTTSVASGRIAYTLGLEGPAITVDTACSSSLVALHLAAQALRAGECTLALAGGATVMSRPGMFVEFSRQRGLAPDGRCKPFAAAADGTAWGEGAGILLLERLSEARRHGHPVLAVLRGSATNQDGASNGLSAPNGPSQERVIRAALAAAGLRPSEVDAVEAHGTGTALGDPIEAQALLATYGKDRDEDRPLWLGSLKSNIGHTQAAAGVAGVIKMVLALRHGVLPETLHLDAPSPHVDWSAGTVRLLTAAQPWAENGQVRRAGVSSFGISGTNAHVIVEASPAMAPDERADDEGRVDDEGQVGAETADGASADQPVVPWVVHGRTPDALRAQAAALAAHLDSLPDAAPYDVAHSLLTTRAALEHRAAVIGAERTALLAELHAVAEGDPGPHTATGAVPTSPGPGAVFVFPGQGSQWVGMAVELLDSSPVFAGRLAVCEAALEPFVDWSLIAALRGVEGAPGLDRVDVVQPVLWAVMVSLAEVWRAHGVEPAAVVGHSQGEIAAACVAGALSLEDGARVVALRSKAIRALSGRGGMVSVALSSSEVSDLIKPWGGRVSVAAVNGPSSVVVSGDADALDELMAGCREREVRARRIEVDYASHSAHVESIREELLEVLAPVVPRPAEVPLFSTVRGAWLDTAEMDAGYWFTNLRRAVEFAPAIEALTAAGHRTFVEVSPHPVLTVPLQETVEDEGADAVVTGTLRRDDGGLARLYTSLGVLYAHGVDVDWSPAFAERRPHRVELPTYAFQRQRFWLEPEAPAVAASPEEEAFWTAVGDQDAATLAGTLGLPGAEALDEVLPALSSWHRNRRQRGTADGWRYRVVWRPLTEPAARQLDGDWLVVVPAGYEDDALVHGAREALAEAGARAHSLTVDDSAGLTDLLRAGPGPFAGVLSLLALDERPDRTHPCVPTGLSLTLALLQALGDAGIDAPLWCVTRGAVGIGMTAEAATGGCVGQDDAPVNPDQAGIWGLGRVAALEHPERWGGLIDLPGQAGGQAAAEGQTAADGQAAVDGREVALLAQILAAGDDEDQLAVRGAAVFGRRLLPAPAAGKPARRSWRPRGTVLVTGGTGALGAHIARWLAANGAEHLVLTGRRGADAPGVAALCSELHDQGVQVTVAGCDIADRQAVADLVRQIERDGEPVRAVVHAAGVSALGSLAEAGPADLAAALAGKVAGADHLSSALDPAQLDAVVYFSSISGTWGVAEHGAYAAANALLDARAERGRADGLPVLSVAWGPWAGGGMIADSIHDVLRRRGVPVIDPDTALTALQQALDNDDTSIAVADVDWQRFNSVFTSVRPSRLLTEIPQLAADEDGEGSGDDGSGTDRGFARSPLAEQLAGLDVRQRTTTLLDLVREQVASVLGHDKTAPVDSERPFKELGFDSLTAVELRNRLSRATGLRLPRTVVFDHPSPAGLAGYVDAQLTSGEEPATKPATAPAPALAPADDDPIAIVSMACRYPGGVQSPEDLWRLVREGVDAMSAFPTDRGWDLDGLYDPDADQPGRSYVRESGFLGDAADFDAEFFGISPREALAMDPQQRLLLETSWEVFERAGIDPKSLRGSGIGVYMGVTDQEYGNRLRLAAPEQIEGYLATGAATSVASGRVAYTLGLEGPAVTVDTACSSSLVALHMAVRALRSGECSLAVAGAAMVMADPGPFIGFSRQRGLARDGRCKPFSAAADGFALSEGVGVLLVERLSDARRNGHPVLAVVRGTAVNQDGASNGLTAPNGPSQQRVIRAALADARLSAGDVDAVEAHGTGTSLGDPIEAQALLATYGQERDADRPLWLGSVKSNIGHTQTVSGVAGVMKMVLAMRHGELPATLHVDEPSPHVEWSSGAVELLTEARPWTAEEDRPRRAGISSFGISGTNAHVIVEQAEESGQAAESDQAESADGGEPAPSSSASGVGPVVPWVVSGRSADALTAQAERLASRVTGAALSPVDVGWSLMTSRSSFEHRAVAVGSETDELTGKLRQLSPTTAVSDPGRTVFVFPGQGSQWVGMAVELLDSSPVFAGRLAECEAALEPFTDWSLTAVLRGDDGAPGLDRVDVVQPVLWAVMVSLAEVWRAHGVEPAAVVGHSQGEIAAACVAGALNLEDGARVVALRSKAIRALSGRGGMVSVALSSSDVSDLIKPWNGRISVAAVNGPSSVVVSGDADALDELMDGCREREVRARRIEVDYASHSAHVESIEQTLKEALAPVEPRKSSVPLFSTVTGDWLDTAEMDAGYWFTNLRRTVEFAPAIEALVAAGHRTFVEVSPHPVLTVPLQETVESVGADAVVTGTLRRDDGGLSRLYTSLGELYVNGVEVDWSPAFAAHQPQLVDLPTYAFQHRRYWLESGQSSVAGAVDPIDVRFWETVEREDLEGLAATLGLADPGALREVLPALSSWRQGRQQRSTVDSWRYRIVWRLQPEPASGELEGNWLIVVPADYLEDDLVQATSRGLGDRARIMPVSATADRAELVAQLAALAGAADEPLHVLSLLALDDRDAGGHRGVPGSLLSTLALTQALAETEVKARLWAVTQGAVSTDASARGPETHHVSDPIRNPGQAAIWGLARVFGLDHHERWGGLVDLPRTLDEHALRRFLSLLSGDGGGQDEYAIRPSGIHVRRMVRAPLDPSAVAEPWQPRGTVLITGGTGALGAHVARALAAGGAEHLVLAGRRGPDAPGASELSAELTALGARVTVAACDVTDRAAVAKLLDSFTDEAPLTAVVHTAGVVGEARPLHETSLDDAMAAVHAKVSGACHLDELLADHPLDAFVLFSSGAGVWGNGGQGPYAAANAALDALAEWRRAQGRPATSLAWGAWAGGGMVDEAVAEQLRRRGVPAMDPRLAVHALREAVDHGETTLVVADIRWDRFLPAYTVSGPRPLLDELPDVRQLLAVQEEQADEAGEKGSDLPDKLAALPEPKRKRMLLDLVRTHASAVLGHSSTDAVRPTRAFRELGFDSLTGVELRNRLNAATALTLPATLVFDHPTPTALAEYLRDALLPPEPDAGSDSPVLPELQQVASALQAATDDDTRQALTEGLRGLLAHWEGQAPPPVETVDDELAEASDEDMFDLIDRELGIG
ncbi:8,8a-deoxyoleandolide synthase [Streptomyces sp. 2333.5]|uniref:type I polyketide synthase n=1 Tax=unclassified Streptomyces TaxID=2593676 RepID=UPI00089C1823|nr:MULTISPECIES: type I polyketide synthase [unclassified Streptomyces]PJJ06450.1 8,8a-deoxyoleandolide synthase [Streptomyces sp. 2333.5]SEF09987.1 8,8a-deoxyoleandolide synthase [Streptomyces sp. 2112.2]